MHRDRLCILLLHEVTSLGRVHWCSGVDSDIVACTSRPHVMKYFGTRFCFNWYSSFLHYMILHEIQNAKLNLLLAEWRYSKGLLLAYAVRSLHLYRIVMCTAAYTFSPNFNTKLERSFILMLWSVLE